MRITHIAALIFLIISTSPTFANWNIASKGRALGQTIHTSYFLTPHNGQFPVNAKAYLGTYNNGQCVYSQIYDMGTERLTSGEYVDYDPIRLKGLVGLSFNCMSVYYYYQQLVIENFILINDGINYVGTLPFTSQVTIL